MRKKLFLYIIAIIIMATMPACTDSGEKTIQNGQIFDSEELAMHLAQNITFKDTMDKIDDLLAAELYNLDSESFETVEVYASTGATAEEIAVFSAVTDEQFDKIAEGINDRTENQRDGFTNYVPGELTKLQDPLVRQVGNCIVFVVCDDKAQAESVLEDYVSKE
ncbi:MAG: DUF4358 domain-containing protein [Eubacteriales bacterium]|nr:DUF4358 domain-containing protein [Eubacteriales bacterium]MDD4389652.1 DUF4358 domain-containing protein [Eubacteriales bacterium]